MFYNFVLWNHFFENVKEDKTGSHRKDRKQKAFGKALK